MQSFFSNRPSNASSMTRKLSLISFVLSFVLLNGSASGQVSPNFSPQPAALSTGATPASGVEIVPSTAPALGSILYAFYVDSSTRVSYSYSTDGVNYSGQGNPINPSTGGYYLADCNAETGASTCAASAVATNNGIYIAFSEGSTHYLDVVLATQDPQSTFPALQFSLVYRATNVFLTTVPGLIVYNDKLIINYGTNNNPSIHNAGWVSAYDFSSGTWSTYSNNATFPTKPGMAIFGGQLYEITKQNNSQNHIWVSRLDGNGIIIPGSPGEINTNFTVASGITATVYEGNIVFCGTNNNGSGQLDIYSSPDAINWSAINYSSLTMGATAGIAVFNNGLATAFKQDSSNDILSASFAAN